MCSPIHQPPTPPVSTLPPQQTTICYGGTLLNPDNDSPGVKIVSATRPASSDLEFIKNSVDWGAGPRASQYLILAAKAKALLDGRPTPDIKDIHMLIPPILRHRVLPNFNAEAEGLKIDDILEKLIEAYPE